MAGPLAGLKVVELAGLAPAPFATTVLADLGADVVRVDRARPGLDVLAFPHDPLSRARRWIGVDTKAPAGRDIVLRLVEDADVLIEGFRPGVTERLGIGPDECLPRNPRLVYGRITGWGQDGPLAQAAGHDINYIGLAGALEPIGRAGERPVPPLNLLGDFGGGGLLLAMGVLAALVERSASGRGQVVDASMVDGAALLTAGLHGLRNIGMWNGGRGGQHARRRRAVLRHLRDRRRQVRRGRRDRGAVLGRPARRCWTSTRARWPAGSTPSSGRPCGRSSRPCCAPAPGTSGRAAPRARTPA